MREAGKPEDDGIEWLETDGPYADIVLSTRIRLARNLRDFRFGIRAEASDRQEILERARAAAGHTATLADGTSLLMSRLSPASRRLLLERHVVSKELVGEDDAAPPAHSALILASGQTLGIMVNEEDHLRLQEQRGEAGRIVLDVVAVLVPGGQVALVTPPQLHP